MLVLFPGKAVALFNLLGEAVANVLLLLLGELSQLLVSLNLLLDLLVLLLDHIDFGVDLVDVVEQGIVLLVGLDERRHDFLDRSNTSLLLDLRERVLNNIDVSHIHVHQILLLFVIVCPLLESQFKKSSRIGELS